MREAWSTIAFSLTSSLAGAHANHATGQLARMTTIGIGGIGLLFAVRPLERAAERFADKEMPEVSATPDYIAFRKMEVYKAAVEELIVGGITPKERRALDALRAKLGIATADANAMERNIITTRPRTA